VGDEAKQQLFLNRFRECVDLLFQPLVFLFQAVSLVNRIFQMFLYSEQIILEIISLWKNDF
jgi:hypothetical protein